MADESFREIQLNGKHLIFLFMTAAVVLVVAFLLGVLVGRGVRTQKDGALAVEALAQTAPAPAETVPAAASSAQPASSTSPPPNAAVPPQPPDEDLSYYSRLESQKPPAEHLKPAGQPAGAAAAAPDRTPAAPKTAATEKKEAKPGADASAPAADTHAEPPAPAAAGGEPAGAGYSLKVVAYKERAQADAMAARLAGKGYSTYVVSASTKGALLYSVRVGKFKTRREADDVRRRLEKEEQLKPLITR
jgi:cell division septation protein DedD